MAATYCDNCKREFRPSVEINGGELRAHFPRVTDTFALSIHAIKCHHPWHRTYAHYSLDGQARTWTVDTAEPQYLEMLDSAARDYAAELARQAAERPWLAPLVALDREGALYLRFGKPPKGGRSRNYQTGEIEAGISVYSASIDPATAIITLNDVGVDPGTLLTSVGMQAYLLTGDALDESGSDGEPLISNPRILAVLTYSPTREGWSVNPVKEPAGAH
jgi:hypothetical protein